MKAKRAAAQASARSTNQEEYQEPPPEEYGLGHRILPDRHAPQPVGGEVEAGYGIGNRVIENLSTKQVFVPGLTDERCLRPSPVRRTTITYLTNALLMLL